MEANATPKPLSMGKLILGVCCGILLAGAISGGAWYSIVEYNHSRNAAANIGSGFEEMHESAVLANDKLQLENDRLDAQIDALKPKRADRKAKKVAVVLHAKFEECDQFLGTTSKQQTCEAAVAPGAPVNASCASIYQSAGHVYRECVAERVP